MNAVIQKNHKNQSLKWNQKKKQKLFFGKLFLKKCEDSEFRGRKVKILEKLEIEHFNCLKFQTRELDFVPCISPFSSDLLV
jgi:hypothetical protein